MQLASSVASSAGNLSRRPAVPAGRNSRSDARRVAARGASGRSTPGTVRFKPADAGNGTGLSGLLGTLTRGLTRSISKQDQTKRQDVGTVFVAGATGRLGVRIIRELLLQGLRVRAGARDVERAAADMQTAVKLGLVSREQLARLQWVPFDLTDRQGMAEALGGASKVVCTVGAAENQLDPSAPRRIDGDGTIALIEAAAAAGVQHFVLISSLGTGKLGFPAGVLNLFWGVLLWKRRAEEALEASGMAYTIVRPGGMERPTDAYKRTHNLVLAPRDTRFGGQVSRLQVAELVGEVLACPELSANKVLEVVAEADAPARSTAELLADIQADCTPEEQAAAREVQAEARQELQAAQQAAAEAAEKLALAQEKVAQLNGVVAEARANEKSVSADVAAVLKEGASAERSLQAAQQAAEQAELQASAARAVLEAAKKAGQRGELLSPAEIKAVAQGVLNPPKQQEQRASRPASPLAGFGLFGAPKQAEQQQEAAEEEEQEKVVVQRPASPLAALFGRPKPVPVEEPAAEEEEEEEQAQQPAAPARPQPLFAGLFGGAKQAQVEQEEEPQQEEAAPVVPAAKMEAPMARKAAPAARKEAPAPAKREEEEAAAAEEKDEPQRAAPAKPAGGLFAGLFGGGQPAMVVGDDTKINVPSTEEAPAKRRAEPAIAQPPPPPVVRQDPVPAKVETVSEEKRKAAIEAAKARLAAQQEAEADALARIKAEREAAAAKAAAEKAAKEAAEREAYLKEQAAKAAAAEKAAAEKAAAEKAAAEKAAKEAEAKAKAEAEAEAAAEKAAAQKAAVEKAAAEKAAAQKAAADKAAAAKPKEAEAPKPVVAAAPAAQGGEVTPEVASARAWIAAYRARMGTGGVGSGPSNGTPSASAQPAAAQPAAGDGDVPANVAEARAWIAAYKKRVGQAPADAEEEPASQGSDGAAAGEPGNPLSQLGKLFGISRD